jgi:hypothetical protein
MRRPPSLIAAVACAACSGGQHVREHEAAAFDCRGRTISYVAAHAMAAAEVGIIMDCTNGPHIKQWTVDAKTNERKESAREMSAGEFNKVWSEIAGTGWENLKDCKRGDGGKSAPLYQFDIKDDQNSASFSCQSLNVPYPYNDLVDPLNAAAANSGSD